MEQHRSTRPSVRTSGLEGVVVADTSLSLVDGEHGRLVLRGHLVEHLEEWSFEEVAGLLRTGTRPVDLQSERQIWGRARERAFERLGGVAGSTSCTSWLDTGWLGGRVAVDAARAAVGRLSGSVDNVTADVGRGCHDEDVEIAATVAMAVVGWAAARDGRRLAAPDPTMSHAADVLRMLRGADASKVEVRALDRYWGTVVDHGLNASTFAARVIASTGVDTPSAMVGALAALKGPLHGGAPGPALTLLERVDAEASDGTPLAAAAERVVREELAGGRRLMGFGHRVYRVRDPRAQALERMVERLAGQLPAVRRRLDVTRALEEAAVEVLREQKPGRPLAANVELYTAVLLEALGVGAACFTAMFACARVVGWCAHVAEQRQVGRLLRPTSNYVGPIP